MKELPSKKKFVRGKKGTARPDLTITAKEPVVDSINLVPPSITVNQTPKDTSARRTGLTIQRILRESDRKAKIRAKRVKIGNVKIGLNRNDQLTILARTWSTIDDEGNPRSPKDYYRTRVTSLDKDSSGKPLKLSVGRVMVSCSCPYFPFWGCEVPLTWRGAAKIHYSNGAPPDLRNPDYKKRVCKHTLKLFEFILRNKL